MERCVTFQSLATSSIVINCHVLFYFQFDSKSISSITGRQYSVKKLSEKFDVVNFRDASRAAENVLFENEAFVDVRSQDD